MKFAAAYYLLLIYLTVMLQPLIPIVEDGLAHCFAEAYHIATVHAKYGNNHIEKEIADTNDDNSKSNKNALKEDNTTAVHIGVTQQIYSFDNISTEVTYFMQPKSSVPKIYLNIVIPPPKFFL